MGGDTICPTLRTKYAQSQTVGDPSPLTSHPVMSGMRPSASVGISSSEPLKTTDGTQGRGQAPTSGGAPPSSSRTRTTASVKSTSRLSAPLNQGSPTRPQCVICTLSTTCKTPWMYPFYPKGWSGKVMLLAEAPGKHEDETSGRPLTGPAGKLLAQLLAQARYEPRDIVLGNVLRCRPPGNATPTMLQIRACRPFVLGIVNKLKPEVLIGLGSVAAKCILNDGSATVTGLRGRPLVFADAEHQGLTFVTYHPAAILRGMTHLADEIVADLDRARWPVLPWPDEELAAGRTIAVDTEYAPDGRLITVGFANATKAIAFEEGPEWESVARFLSGME